MVGIVVVSHSRALARAAVELAREMVHGRDVRIAVAAGLDETTLGTDAVQIKAAIEEVDGQGGVLVLMDLGSAVLSAELALDLLEAEVGSRVVLCPAPLVEGLVVATVAAAGGAELADVAQEASAALAGKQGHLAPAATPSEPAAPDVVTSAPEATGVFVVGNEHGLHARPAARLVAEVRGLDACVTLRNITTGSASVPAASLSRVATLGALQGHEIEVTADGRQAHEALKHVLALADRHFDEAVATRPGETDPGPVPGGAPASSAGALAAAPGIAVGPVWNPEAVELQVPDQPAGDPAAEWRRFGTAIAAVRHDTVRLRARTAQELGEGDAAIFDAHLMLLDDAELLAQVRRGVDAGRAPEAAWEDTVSLLAEEMTELADPYQRARAADVRSVGDQVLRSLLGVTSGFESRDGVLVTTDLTPAEVSGIDPAKVQGIVLAYGSPTAHSAILARTVGIPMVVAAGPDVLAVPEGTLVALDGTTAELVIDPDQETLDRNRARAQERRRVVAEALAVAEQPARTKDGIVIEVAANVGSLRDAEQARETGADAAGLVRTEFLFLDRVDAPDVDEQEAAYRALADALDGRRLTLRTLDVGGDKPLSYLPTAHEANPFLGLRGIRLSLARTDLLRDQLIAACRVARDGPVDLMFPMVSTVDELVAALGVLDEAVTATGAMRPPGLRVGIMVEVPAAALKAASFVPYVDFFSIGTNDLTQYTLAAERGNDAVARLADPLDPAVLRLIDAVCHAASGRADVAVCGELASDETAIPVLLGLGVRELSVVPTAVPLVKQAVRQVDRAAAARLARQALDAAGAKQVRALLAAPMLGSE